MEVKEVIRFAANRKSPKIWVRIARYLYEESKQSKTYWPKWHQVLREALNTGGAVEKEINLLIPGRVATPEFIKKAPGVSIYKLPRAPQ